MLVFIPKILASSFVAEFEIAFGLIKLGDVLPIGHMVINRIGDLRRVAGKRSVRNQYKDQDSI